MDVRREYIARINKVMDYIEANITQPINREVLAEIANFSPYHFHRIFSTLIGESPVLFLQRIRVEKAAQQLRYQKQIAISDVAQDCGFSSVSLFSRTFRKYYGITAKEFRNAKTETLTQNGHYYSNTGELVRKYKQAVSNSILVSENVELNQLIIPNIQITIKRMPEMKVIYCRHTGAFYKIGKAYSQLMEWAGKQGLLNFPQTKLITVYHDDPSITKMKQVRQSACITIVKSIKVDGEFGKMTIPAGKYAVGRFEISPQEFEKAWNTMSLWIIDNGCQLTKGNDYELYYSPLVDGKFTLDICIPVE